MLVKYLNNEGNSIVKEVQANIQSAGKNASGETSRSLLNEVKETEDKLTMRISGSPWFFTLETGRKPTKPNAKKGDPTLIEKIKRWVLVKGIDISPYAITKKIHNKGTKLYRQGGRKDIFSNVITEEKVRDIQDQIANITLKATADGIIERYNKR